MGHFLRIKKQGRAMSHSSAVNSHRTTSRSLTDGSIVGALVRLSNPIVMANVLQTAYQMTDTFGSVGLAPKLWPR
jgi:Na+-driven multidrug efflux pump